VYLAENSFASVFLFFQRAREVVHHRAGPTGRGARNFKLREPAAETVPRSAGNDRLIY
jgi:hypothetical protein